MSDIFFFMKLLLIRYGREANFMCFSFHSTATTSRNINEFDVRGVLSCSFAKLWIVSRPNRPKTRGEEKEMNLVPKTSAAILWRINSPKIHDSRQHKIEMSFVTLRPCLWSFYYPISSLSPTVDSWSRPCWRNKSDIKRHMAKDTKWRFQRRERHEDTTRIES